MKWLSFLFIVGLLALASSACVAIDPATGHVYEDQTVAMGIGTGGVLLFMGSGLAAIGAVILFISALRLQSGSLVISGKRVGQALLAMFLVLPFPLLALDFISATETAAKVGASIGAGIAVFVYVYMIVTVPAGLIYFGIHWASQKKRSKSPRVRVLS